MATDDLVLFIRGASAMGFLALSLFFLRYWTRSRDRLFAIFAVAFALLAVHYVAMVTTDHDETEAIIYGVRAIAFALIIVAVLDKNRRPD